MPETPELRRVGKNLALSGLFDEPVRFASSVRYEKAGSSSSGNRRRRAQFSLAGSGDPPPGGPIRLQCDEIDMTIGCSDRAGGISLEWQLRVHRRSAPIRLLSVIPAVFDDEWPHLRDPGQARVFQNGFQSWTPSFPKDAASSQVYPRSRFFELMNHHVDSPLWGRKDGLISSGFLLLKQERNPESALIGFLSFRQGLGEIFLKNSGGKELVASVDYGGKLLEPGETLKGESLWLARGKAGPLLDAYALETGKEMEARTGRRAESPGGQSPGSPVGWCSWYEYYNRVNERDIVSNLEKLDQSPELGVKFVQLDDGYQPAVGDWLETNSKFPSGLEILARKIREKGFLAGLWTAPFFASGKSKLFREHPEYFLLNKQKKKVFCGVNPLWLTRLYALDLTNPEVESWLHRTFKALAHKGFDYFKVDFLFAGLRTGLFSDPARSPVEAYRNGLRIIREAIGERRFLLGCGAPLGPSVGLVDGMRISADVKEVWDSPVQRFLGDGCGYPSVRLSIVNNITRSFMHGAWWMNDPDCLLVRSRNTKLTQAETETLVTVLGMTGGLLFLSDNLRKLTGERLETAKAVLPPTPLRGLPADLPLNTLPETYKLEGRGTRRLYALINWSGKPCLRPAPSEIQQRTVDAAAKPAVINADPANDAGYSAGTRPDSGSTSLYFDFWREQVVDDAELEIGKHGVRSLLATDCPSFPEVIGTTFHLTALVDERIESSFYPDSGILRVSGRDLSRRGGRLWLFVPAGYAFDEKKPLPSGLRVETAGRFPVMAFEAEAPWSIEICFRHEAGQALP